MKKFFLFALLCTATIASAVTKVESFTTEDGTVTNTYVTAETSKKCDQATWTFFSGGILKNLGNMGQDNFSAVIRARKNSETITPYIYSDSIADGIDSLWFTWNSNGNEAPFGNWNIKIYINDDLVGNITNPGAAKIAAAGPFNQFHVGNLKKEGKFVIRIVNESYYDTTANYMRFVFDNLSWTTYGSAPVKNDPTFKFAESLVFKKLDAAASANTLTNTSDGTPVFESSNPEVATVDQDGNVTVVALGTTTITASVEETEEYKAASASYTLRVMPLNFNIETFDGAANITSGTSAYLTAVTAGTPSTATGITLTTLLGSVRDGLGSWPAANIACALRAKKTAEAEHGYLESSVISGGIDSLTFEWNANGSEASRTKNWDIRIYINGDSVGAITDKPTAKMTAGNEYRYSIGNIKKSGNFTIKIVNNNDADNGTDNQYRWVMDNLEWYSYEGTPSAIDNTNVQREIRKEMINGQLIINIDGVRYNMQGQQL